MGSQILSHLSSRASSAPAPCLDQLYRIPLGEIPRYSTNNARTVSMCVLITRVHLVIASQIT